MNYQDLQNARIIIKEFLQTSPSVKISTLYLRLRKKRAFSYIGDYPLLATIVTELKENNYPLVKASIKSVFELSNELKQRKTLVNAFFMA